MDATIPPMKQILRHHLETKRDAWQEPKPAVYHAHQAWQCHRALWYMRQNVPEEKGKSNGIFEMGHAAEERVEDSLVTMFGRDFVRNNLPCQEQFNVAIAGENFLMEIVGKTDPAIFGFNLKPRVLIESKSKKGDDKVKVKTQENQKMQGCWYASRLGFPELRIVHPGRGDLLAMPETDCVITEPEISYRAKLVREFFRRQFIMDLRRVPPPGRPFDTENECRNCSFPRRCQEDGGPGTPADSKSYERIVDAGEVVAQDGGGLDGWI